MKDTSVFTQGEASVTRPRSLTKNTLPESMTIIRLQNGNRNEITTTPVPFGADRANEIQRKTPLGCDLERRMTDSEIAYVNAVWEEMPGTYSFADTLSFIQRKSIQGGAN